MDADLTLYIGGTRSGKSAAAEAHARACAERHGGTVLYVATAVPSPDDRAMCERIARHRRRRPAHWLTLECPADVARSVAACLDNAAHRDPVPNVVLLDCVTLWVTNMLLRRLRWKENSPEESSPEERSLFEAAVRAEIEALLALMETRPCHWVLVSGETGLGGIGSTPLTRLFHDGLGLANQLLARRARQAFLVVAGRLLPLQ